MQLVEQMSYDNGAIARHHLSMPHVPVGKMVWVMIIHSFATLVLATDCSILLPLANTKHHHTRQLHIHLFCLVAVGTCLMLVELLKAIQAV